MQIGNPQGLIWLGRNCSGVFWNVCRVKTKYWELTADCITRWSYRFEDREVDNLCCLWDVCKPRSRRYNIYNFESPYEVHCHHQLNRVFSQSYIVIVEYCVICLCFICILHALLHAFRWCSQSAEDSTTPDRLTSNEAKQHTKQTATTTVFVHCFGNLSGAMLFLHVLFIGNI